MVDVHDAILNSFYRDAAIGNRPSMHARADRKNSLDRHASELRHIVWLLLG
jgi:hypothetical protein